MRSLSKLSLIKILCLLDIYATATQQLVQRFDPPLDSPALSPDGLLVALYNPDQSAEVIYEVQSGRRCERCLPLRF
jgi:hypothetical protein